MADKIMPLVIYRQIFIVLLLAFFVCCGTSNAELIDKDIVWSGDILVDSKVIVDEGATLLIAPGSRVTFRPMPAEAKKGGGRLIVFGRLIAQGTSDSPILFTSASLTPEAGDWEGLRFEQTDQKFSRLDHCVVEYARAGINGRSSYLQVENSHFRYNHVGIIARNSLTGGLFDCLISENSIGVKFEQNDHLKIVNSRIKNNHESGVIYSNSSPIIQHSLITGNGKYGISCQRSSSPLIENNLIKDHEVGLRAEMMSSPTVLHNEIESNETAISLERISFAVIENNRIRQNAIGIYCNLGAYPHIHRNNIFENRVMAVDLGTYMSIVVARNPPFDARTAMNLSVPDNKQSATLENNDATSHFPKEGIIDAYGNWWGEDSLQQLRSSLPNKDLFEDGHDEPAVFYRNKTYPRDRIGYAGWVDEEMEQARRAPVKFSGVKGRITQEGQPMAGLRVYVYREADNSVDGEGLTFSSPTGVDGKYVLPLKPGSYRLVARNFVPSVILQTSENKSTQMFISERTVNVEGEGYNELNFQIKRSAESF